MSINVQLQIQVCLVLSTSINLSNILPDCASFFLKRTVCMFVSSAPPPAQSVVAVRYNYASESHKMFALGKPGWFPLTGYFLQVPALRPLKRHGIIFAICFVCLSVSPPVLLFVTRSVLQILSLCEILKYYQNKCKFYVIWRFKLCSCVFR